MASKHEATPRERAYQLTLNAMTAEYLEQSRLYRHAKMSGQACRYELDTLKAMTRLHNQLLDKSGLHGLHWDMPQ